MKDYLKDAWSYVHLFGSCVLTIVLSKFMPSLYADLLWELLDKVNKDYDWNGA